MATMILLPNASSSVSSDWIVVGAGSVENALKYDDGNTAYVKCNDALEFMIIEYANPSVAEAGITSITSVRFLSSGKSAHRTNPSLVDIAFETPSGNPTEICYYDAHRTDFETINGISREYSDGVGGTDWTYSDLEDLEMTITKNGTVEIYLSYLALEVTYTAAVVGYGNDVIGVASGDISKINGIATADISKVNGI